MKKLQLIFNQKYSTIHRIGLSRFSQVYLAFDSETEKQYAIKIQPNQSASQYLEREAKIYRVVKGGTGIPNLYWYGVENNYKALITDIYGPSLKQLMQFCEGKFSLKTTLLIVDQIMDRLEWVHSKKFIYNDIDPQNFLVGLKQQADKIFMVDFGNCKKYLDQNNKHIQYQTDSNPMPSNIIFRSTHAHIHKNLSRRDDLESLGYLMVYMLKGQLPWQDITKSNDQSEENYELIIKQRKISIPISILCEDLPNQFNEYFEYVRYLEFEEEPDYTWIKRLFRDLFDDMGYQNNRVMDWAEKHKY